MCWRNTSSGTCFNREKNRDFEIRSHRRTATHTHAVDVSVQKHYVDAKHTHTWSRSVWLNKATYSLWIWEREREKKSSCFLSLKFNHTHKHTYTPGAGSVAAVCNRCFLQGTAERLAALHWGPAVHLWRHFLETYNTSKQQNEMYEMFQTYTSICKLWSLLICIFAVRCISKWI